MSSGALKKRQAPDGERLMSFDVETSDDDVDATDATDENDENDDNDGADATDATDATDRTCGSDDSDDEQSSIFDIMLRLRRGLARHKGARAQINRGRGGKSLRLGRGVYDMRGVTCKWARRLMELVAVERSMKDFHDALSCCDLSGCGGMAKDAEERVLRRCTRRALLEYMMGLCVDMLDEDDDD